MTGVFTVFLALTLLQATPKGEVSPLVIRGARIVTVAQEEIEEGILLVESGLIRSVGKDITPPKEAEILDYAQTCVVVPGFMDVHSHLGSVFEIEEGTTAITPQVKAIDALSTTHADVAAAKASGVTLVLLAPGNGNVVGGQMALLHMNGGRLDQMVVRDTLGLKLSLGDESLRADREPTSRSGMLTILRDALRLSGRVRTALVEQRQIALVHADRLGDIERALVLKEEFGLRLILVHAGEAWRMVRQLKDANVAVAVGPLTVSDSVDRLRTPALLAREGIKLAFVTDAPVTSEADLRTSALLAIKHGLDPKVALRALTLGAAEMLGVGNQFGSLEPGKTADFVVYDGDPLSLASAIELVVIEGRIVYRKPKK